MATTVNINDLLGASYLTGKALQRTFQNLLERTKLFIRMYNESVKQQDVNSKWALLYSFGYLCNEFNEHCVFIIRSHLNSKKFKDIPTSNIELARYFGRYIIDEFGEDSSKVEAYMDLLCNVIDKRNEIIHRIDLSWKERSRLIIYLSSLIVKPNTIEMVNFLLRYNIHTINKGTQVYYTKPARAF